MRDKVRCKRCGEMTTDLAVKTIEEFMEDHRHQHTQFEYVEVRTNNRTLIITKKRDVV